MKVSLKSHYCACAALLLLALSAGGQEDPGQQNPSQENSDEENADRNFDLPAADVDSVIGGLGPEFDDANFIGTPRAGFMQAWPNDLVIAPVPGYSPQVGWSLALASGFFFDLSSESEEAHPSIIGGFYWGSENGSSAYGAGGNLHLLDDNLRVTFGVGRADVRYILYSFGQFQGNSRLALEIEQEGPVYFASASWRIWNQLYAGLGYIESTVDTRPRVIIGDPNDPADPGQFFDPRLTTKLGAVTVPLAWDTRDHEQFPTSGWKVDGRATIYRERFGSDFDAETYMLSANNYRTLRGGNVIATRAYFRTAGDGVPFFLLSTLGGSKDLRGYPGGRYRAKMMYALQAEYRWRFNDQWVFTGFAGFGEVADDSSEFGDEFLPAGGVGARFVVSQKHRISLSFDIARGKEDTEFYFGINEAF